MAGSGCGCGDSHKPPKKDEKVKKAAAPKKK